MLGRVLSRLQQAANLDEEFRLAAREWTTTLRLESGSDAHRVTIEAGRITSVREAGAEPAAVRIAAPEADWREFLAALPRPFYQDLWGAMSHHDFVLEGDLTSFYPWYPAAQRLFQLLREQAG